MARAGSSEACCGARAAAACRLCFLSTNTQAPAPPPASLPARLQLLGYIKKDKQGDALIEKLCQRFAATQEPAQWHSIAFCLTQVRLLLLAGVGGVRGWWGGVGACCWGWLTGC